VRDFLSGAFSLLSPSDSLRLAPVMTKSTSREPRFKHRSRGANQDPRRQPQRIFCDNVTKITDVRRGLP
jgi:hypothetical protein